VSWQSPSHDANINAVRSPRFGTSSFTRKVKFMSFSFLRELLLHTALRMTHGIKSLATVDVVVCVDTPASGSAYLASYDHTISSAAHEFRSRQQPVLCLSLSLLNVEHMIRQLVRVSYPSLMTFVVSTEGRFVYVGHYSSLGLSSYHRHVNYEGAACIWPRPKPNKSSGSYHLCACWISICRK
jgi:hypothetical protein